MNYLYWKHFSILFFSGLLFIQCQKEVSIETQESLQFTDDCISNRNFDFLTFTSINDGNWNEPSTWDQGSVPTPSNHIVINHMVAFPDETSSLAYEHLGDITVEQSGVLRLQSRLGNFTGQPFIMTGSILHVDGELITNEDLILDGVVAVFTSGSTTDIGDDLIVLNSTSVQNDCEVCSDFSVGDDIYLIGSQTVISGSGTIIYGQSNLMGQSTGSTPPATLAPYVSGQEGATLDQLRCAHGPSCDALTAALPVDFVSIEASWQDHTVDIIWTTASEINNAGFYVTQAAPCESLEDASIVSPLIEPIGEEGGTYRFSVPVDSGGTYYYRIQQTDLDGRVDYSDYVSVRVGR